MRKKQQQQYIIGSVFVVLLLAFLYTQTTVFQTALTSYDFTHYIIKNQAAQDPLSFGDEDLIISDPIYSKSCDQVRKYPAPSPSESCWSAKAVFMGQTYILPYGQNVAVGDCLTLNWKSNVYVDNGELEPTGTEKDYVQVSFEPDSCLTFSTSVANQVKFGDNTVLTITTDSTLPDGMPVTIETKAESTLFNIYDTFGGENLFSLIKTTINTGTSNTDVTVETPKLGKYKLSTHLVPAIYYSDGIYKESTDDKVVATTVVSPAIYNNPELATSVPELATSVPEPEGKSILTGSITTILTNPAETIQQVGSNTWMWFIIFILVGILFYNLYKIKKKQR